MPIIDATRGLLVVRIVYDGPALSGKTTSLKALARGVASQVESPEERDGRTLYFDWLEYTGGIFEGRQIRCQIVSVPGQRELAHRRKQLIASADAVVCVLDTRRAELDFALQWLADVTEDCRKDSPPVGVVLQANKRDAADAVPRAELRERVNDVAPIAIVESVATASDGIREAFVLAVRLALDRVRALSSEGRLRVGQPSENDAADLLRTLRRSETESHVALVPITLTHHHEPPPPQPELRASEIPPADGTPELMFTPDPSMPGGMIWPPVDGRALLHEVANLSIRPERTTRGDWWGSGSGWRFHSSPRALFGDGNAARTALISWARQHAANATRISNGRAVILADAGAGRFRLWQLVRVEPTLRERLDAVLGSTDARTVAEGLLDVTTQLLAAHDWFASSSVSLPCTLWTVGSLKSSRPCFVGLMPELSAHAHTELASQALLEHELAPHLRELRRARVDFSAVLREVMTRAELARPDSPARKLAELARAVH